MVALYYGNFIEPIRNVNLFYCILLNVYSYFSLLSLVSVNILIYESALGYFSTEGFLFNCCGNQCLVYFQYDLECCKGKPRLIMIKAATITFERYDSDRRLNTAGCFPYRQHVWNVEFIQESSSARISWKCQDHETSGGKHGFSR